MNPKGEMKGRCHFQEQFSDQFCKVVLSVHLMPPDSGACALLKRTITCLILHVMWHFSFNHDISINIS